MGDQGRQKDIIHAKQGAHHQKHQGKQGKRSVLVFHEQMSFGRCLNEKKDSDRILTVANMQDFRQILF